jgi:5-methylcytosine-specific restriction protein B
MENGKINDLFESFLSNYQEEKKNAIWKAHSEKFQKFWNERIMNSESPDLNDEEIDAIIRILDSKGKGNTRHDESVASVMIPQDKWRNLFRQLRMKKDLAICVNSILTANSSEVRVSKIDELYKINLGNRNNFTGQSGNGISSLLAAYDPFENLSIVSLNHRYGLLKELGVISFPVSESVGRNIEETSRLIKSKFEEYGIHKNARVITAFAYSADYLKLWKDTSSNTKEFKEKNVLEDPKYDHHYGKRYWRIGTTNETGKFWDLMLKENYASMGWAELGDLREHNPKTKFDAANLLKKVGFYNENEGLATRKGGEVLNFYSQIKTGDVILAQEGHKVHGIGIVTNKYEYKAGLIFPNIRPVDWKIVEPENFNNPLGPLTTVFEISDADLIKKIEGLLSGVKNNSNKFNMNLNTILYGPPGTGKTYNTINKALEIIGEEIEGKSRNEIKKLFEIRSKEGQILFTTFHQSMSYEDFIEGIKPQEPLKAGDPISYKTEDGIFKQLCKSAETLTSATFELSYNKLLNALKDSGQGMEIPTSKETITISAHPNGVDLSVESTTYINTITKWGLKYVSDSHRFVGVGGPFYKAIFKVLTEKYGYQEEKKESNKKYVLIIDEINRGNVSQIFGELITLIEEDKRLGNAEALETTLPYSKEKFGVPPNLYIIGTMNTADRSVEALDTALRRRFSFMEMMPVYDLPGMEKEIAGVELGVLLETINKRIEKLLDRDHQIGHSYFLNIESETDLMLVFKDKVIPLLQEYFYGNYERMGLVLGNGFVEKLSDDSVRFAKFQTEDNDYNDKTIYRLRKDPLIDKDLFKEALINLMN